MKTSVLRQWIGFLQIKIQTCLIKNDMLNTFDRNALDELSGVDNPSFITRCLIYQLHHSYLHISQCSVKEILVLSRELFC